MIALVTATAKILIGTIIALALVSGTACGVWQIIYYGCDCRRNPVEKTAVATAFALVVICAAIIKIL